MDFSFLKDLPVDVKPNARLSEYTTFRLGGKCRCLISCREPDHLEAVIERLSLKKVKFILIGGGSNLLASDGGVDCVVVRYFSSPFISQTDTAVFVSGATLLDDLARFAVTQSLEGMSFATGIPGTVGGAIVGNAGAFGKQVGDILESVWLINQSGKKYEAKLQDLKFQYRHSVLKETGEIVLAAKFNLKRGDKTIFAKKPPNIF